MRITYKDIRNRITGLSSVKRPTVIPMQESMLYTKHGEFCKENAINVIKHWESLDENTDVAYMKALDVFDEICNNCNVSTIKSSAEVLIEANNKVRDHKSFIRSLKIRIGRADKKATTSFKNVSDDVTKAINGAISNAKSVNVAGPNLPSPVTISGPQSAAKSEAYNAIYAESVKNSECDRIMENYSTISRRFNIDKIIGNIRTNYDCQYACVEIASCIDTYNAPFKNRYNAALEAAVYAFDKHFMNYPRKNIVEAVTDYFILSGSITEANLSEVKNVLTKSVIIDEEDTKEVNKVIDDVMKENDDQSDEFAKDIDKQIDDQVSEMVLGYGNEDIFSEALGNQIKGFVGAKTKEAKAAAKELKKAAKEGNADEHDKASDMIEDFRKNCIKNKDNETNVSRFKAMIEKLYTKKPYQIINDIGNIFGIVRTIFIISAVGINPILGLVAAFTDQMLKIHYSRKQFAQIIAAYEKEIQSVQGKIKTAQGAYLERYQKYLEELKKDKEKLEDRERDLYSEEENDERDEAKWNAEFDSDDDDSSDDSSDDEDFGDDDWDEDDDNWDMDDEDWDDDDFEEAANIVQISNLMTAISESIIDDSPEGIVFNNVFKATNDSIDDITDFTMTVPSVFDRNRLIECLTDYRNTLRKSNPESRNYMRIDCLNENIAKLKDSVPVYASNTTANSLYYLTCLSEMVKIGGPSMVLEMDFTNNVKLALRNLKDSVVKLGDKEKQMSNSIDIAANNVMKGMQDTMKSNAREKVLKGTVLPSASKCIKTALAAGAAWAINPAIAVVGALAAWATGAKMARKERLVVLDDLDIEIKMTDRYLRQAEENNDLEKVKQYEIMKRNLERARARVRYKTVAAGQRLPMSIPDHED